MSILEIAPYWNPNLSSAAADTDQKQTKIKNLNILFGGDVTICTYPLPICHLLSLILGNFGWENNWLTGNEEKASCENLFGIV